METLVRVAWQIVQLSGYVLLSPIFWVLVLIIGYQYARMGRIKTYLFGVRDSSVLRVTLISILLGMAGGLLGSVLMVLFGVTLPQEGIYYILILAVVLMLVHPRFLCFAYAGGLLSIISLTLGVPRFNVPHLMALVAILHLIESILIWCSGHLDALPIYTRNTRDQEVGGFNLQKFWPVPLIVLTITTGITPQEGLAMPEWWPLLNPGEIDPVNSIFTLVPAVVGLGYGELALTVSPRQRSERSAQILALYSFFLLSLAVAASYYPVLSWAAALFAPLGHEFVVYRSQREEMEGAPRYLRTLKGVMLLDVIRPSPAYAAGLRGGDVIFALGDRPIRSRLDLVQALYSVPDPFRVGYWRTHVLNREEVSEKQCWTTLYRSEVESLGLILVPGYGGEKYLEFQTAGHFSRWIARWKARWQR